MVDNKAVDDEYADYNDLLITVKPIMKMIYIPHIHPKYISYPMLAILWKLSTIFMIKYAHYTTQLITVHYVIITPYESIITYYVSQHHMRPDGKKFFEARVLVTILVWGSTHNI